MSAERWDRNDQILSDRAMGMTLAAVAAKWGLSRERVRQIERRESFKDWRAERSYGIDSSTWLRHLPVLDQIAGLV